MKRWKWITAVIFCFTLLLGATACGESEALTFRTLVFEENEAHLTVSNETDTFSFADEIKAKWNTKFAVSSDEYGQNTFLTKVVPLAEGDNVFYVFAMNGEEITQTYTVTIRRRPMYTISFEGLGETYRVEEGSLAVAAKAIPTKDYYTFDSWDFDFTQPITQSTAISATWNFAKEEVFVIEGTTLVGLTEKAKESSRIPPEFFEGLQGVTAIGNRAFYGCHNLTEVIIPDSVTFIGDGAFRNCDSLTSFTIPNSVTSIGEKVLYLCSSLESVALPFASTTHFGYFFGASSYSNNGEVVPASLKSVSVTSGTSIPDSAFYNCNTLKSITIPSSVTSIGDDAFSLCSSLTSFTIPNSVTSIGNSAFWGCSSLESITLPFKNIPHFGYLFGASSYSNNGFFVPTSLKSVSITFGASIPDSAFEGCSTLRSITILNSVTRIGNSAFERCICLESITIPNSVTNIGNSAFEGCSSLESIMIPESVTSIGYGAFFDCDSLMQIYYGGSAEKWTEVENENTSFTSKIVHFYSESEPTASGNFWHYNENGEIAIW